MDRLSNKWDEVSSRLKALHFDRYDYAAMKFLALFDCSK
jgi:hypothetical protein